MVHITPQTVESFKKMFKNEYGVEYSDQEAWEATHNLLGAFETLLQMDKTQHPENYTKMKNQLLTKTHIVISSKDFLLVSIHKTREMQMRSLEKYLEKNNRIFTFEGNMCVVQVYDKQDAIRIGMENRLREVLYVEGTIQVKLQIVADPSSVKRTKIIVSDSNGNKTSLRKIKQQPRLEAKKNSLTKGDIVKRMILTKKELDVAISSGQLTVTIIGKTGYIERKELQTFLSKKNNHVISHQPQMF